VSGARIGDQYMSKPLKREMRSGKKRNALRFLQQIED